MPEVTRSRDVRRRGALAVVAAMLLSALTAVEAQGVRVLDVEAARAAARAGEMILVDIRTPAEWRESGIPDVAVALDMRAPDFPDRLAALRGRHPARALGLICASGGRSATLSARLARNGMPDVVDVAAGVHGREGWRARGLPLRAAGSAPVTTVDAGKVR